MATAEEGHYSLVPLGGGASGTVCACRRGSEVIALKVFPGRLYRRTRARLDRELAALAGLAEQAGVVVPQAVETMPDGRVALRMELCTQSLARVVAASGPLTVSDVLVLGLTLASTLVAAHRAGIVHGRVTPANVLFRASGEPVLSDFGHTLRDVFTRDGDHGIAYLAPETLDGDAGERSDLYGLGVVLHTALAGRPPFPAAAPDVAALRDSVRHDPAPPVDRPEAPIDLLVLVDRLLEKDPVKRPASAEEVTKQLIRLWEAQEPEPEPGPGPAAGSRLGAEVFAWPPPGAGEPEPAPRKDRAWLLVALPACAAILVAVAWMLVKGPFGVTPSAASGTASTPPGTVEPVSLDLAEPADLGTAATLSWTGPAGWEFAVVAAAEAGPTETTLVRRNRTARVTVDPRVKYCFQVQATDGVRVQVSEPRPFRGATCRE
ncbi:serine/threonine-protein kinase [Amycolatopsis australiensis]|uniref:non-specific serine/threonine protein kinase n=1 Tax=Amycolatopsis australiensis TaxID=546364 RepID=A0A1K1S297_9PSEU|nr:serine/threonine-protein kinase [Amycolatopsis australiensis]SFW78306.1 Serine/threonine protein kinase [Amycolatopsis australiensis]